MKRPVGGRAGGEPARTWTWEDVRRAPAPRGRGPAAVGALAGTGAAEDAVAAPSAPPPGLTASVPVKPTTAMLAAGMRESGLGADELLRTWQAMCAAAERR